MITGQCLCGAHQFQIEGKLELNHHCHCGYCRKHHGTGYVSLVGVAEKNLKWTRGKVISYRSSSGFVRESCATCGTPMPQKIEGLPMFVPAGCLDGLDTTFAFHIFVASKAPWDLINDALPAFDAYPPGVESTALETRPPLDPPGGVRGSCLCGEVRFVIDGASIAARHCHCSRCRLGRGAAHASNLVVESGALRFTNGEASIRRYKIPDAKYFTQCFCEKCGGKAPTVDLSRKIAVVPLGTLDDAPPIVPAEHIWIADKPSWSTIQDDLPQRQGPPAT